MIGLETAALYLGGVALCYWIGVKVTNHIAIRDAIAEREHTRAMEDIRRNHEKMMSNIIYEANENKLRLQQQKAELEQEIAEKRKRNEEMEGRIALGAK